MRRPPALLIIAAVMVAGVGVGWAAGHDTDTPSLAPSAPSASFDREEPSVTVAPAASATSEVANITVGPTGPDASPADPDPADGTGIERVVEADPSLRTEVGEGPPAHLDVSVVPIPAEVADVTPTTSAPTVSAIPAPAQPSVAFTAAQAYGSCDEPIPYDIFSGTADPGSTVTISSPYGSGTAVADGAGHWERKVEFPSAPRGGSFSVTAAGAGGSTVFDFAVGAGGH